ncbi:MAG TPA: gamma-glutamylcyclotransferase family protein [Ferrovibrio sp.]|jgi:hypothetical protein|uniref:gamma-glutamylcyclotransferase family protein n=1 Tax=Ferrovibrio sp. TaxID=1917215 RepID=UPI002ED3750A
MQYFFYGTLCDPDIRRLVLGYKPNRRQLRPAKLTGFRRKQGRGRLYPILIPAPGSVVYGELFQTMRPADVARLAAYEGSEYRARRLPVRPQGGRGSRRVQVFLAAHAPNGGLALPPHIQDWHPARWRRLHKAAFLRSLQR